MNAVVTSQKVEDFAVASAALTAASTAASTSAGPIGAPLSFVGGRRMRVDAGGRRSRGVWNAAVCKSANAVTTARMVRAIDGVLSGRCATYGDATVCNALLMFCCFKPTETRNSKPAYRLQYWVKRRTALKRFCVEMRRGKPHNS